MSKQPPKVDRLTLCEARRQQLQAEVDALLRKPLVPGHPPTDLEHIRQLQKHMKGVRAEAYRAASGLKPKRRGSE